MITKQKKLIQEFPKIPLAEYNVKNFSFTSRFSPFVVTATRTGSMTTLLTLLPKVWLQQD